MRRSVILALSISIPVAVVAATPPPALTRIAGGMWEISGIPGSHAPLQQCVTDVMTLGEFEHRGKTCTRTVISERAAVTKISYKCGSAGFGASDIEVVTPRSLRISTQGISDQLPFNYVLQARRVGECAKPAPDPRH